MTTTKVPAKWDDHATAELLYLRYEAFAPRFASCRSNQERRDAWHTLAATLSERTRRTFGSLQCQNKLKMARNAFSRNEVLPADARLASLMARFFVNAAPEASHARASASADALKTVSELVLATAPILPSPASSSTPSPNTHVVSLTDSDHPPDEWDSCAPTRNAVTADCSHCGKGIRAAVVEEVEDRVMKRARTIAPEALEARLSAIATAIDSIGEVVMKTSNTTTSKSSKVLNSIRSFLESQIEVLDRQTCALEAQLKDYRRQSARLAQVLDLLAQEP